MSLDITKQLAISHFILRIPQFSTKVSLLMFHFTICFSCVIFNGYCEVDLLLPVVLFNLQLVDG